MLEETVREYLAAMFFGLAYLQEEKNIDINTIKQMNAEDINTLLDKVLNESKTLDTEKCQKYLQLYRELQKIFKKSLDN